MSRLADLVIAFAVLAFTLPLMILVAIAIRLDSPGPIFESDTCIGRRGRRFQMLRFRTTVPSTDNLRPAWTQPEDISIGVFLRSTRIDRLPQLINVLCGDISMVEMDGSPSFLE